MTALYSSPMMASAEMVMPLSVAEAPMGCPILSMTSVWATAPPKRGAKTSTGAGRIPAALEPTASTTAITAAITAMRPKGLRVRRAA